MFRLFKGGQRNPVGDATLELLAVAAEIRDADHGEFVSLIAGDPIQRENFMDTLVGLHMLRDWLHWNSEAVAGAISRLEGGLKITGDIGPEGG